MLFLSWGVWERGEQQLTHTGNDFEFFVDSAGSTHGYKQVDVNAAGTVWGIALTKSYLDGGSGPRPSCPRPAPPPDPCPRLASGGSAVGGLQCVV